MPEIFAPVIEAATRPFSENAELKHSAADFLAERLTGKVEAEAAMIARWNEVDARKRKSVWRIVLWATVAMVAAVVAFRDSTELSRLFYWGKWLSTGSFFGPMPAGSEKVVADKLNASQKLLVFGDLTKTNSSDRKEALWCSEPENPAFFAEYAAAFLANNSKLPPNFLETAQRIDPTNAWFTYFAAAVEADGCVKAKSRKGKKVDGRMIYETPKTWEILDQARMDRALELLRQARDQPKCTCYGAEMLRKRIPLLPQETYLEQLDSISCLGFFSVFPSIHVRKLADVIAAKAWMLGEAGATAEFQEISGHGDQFQRKFSSEFQGVMVDELVQRVIASTLAESFGSAAQKLGLEKDAAHWKRIDEWCAESKQRRGSRDFMVDGKAVERGTITGGIIAGSTELLAMQTETPPPLTDADLKPMRLVDHEFLSWAFSYVSWAVISVCAFLIACYRFRVSVLSRSMARRMEDLLCPSDRAWIVLAGIVLPFMFVMAVNRLTPLGGRDFGVRGTAFLMPAGHFLGLLLLWLVMPVQIIRWRLAKRAAGFGFPKPHWSGLVAVACAAVFVPMIGWAAIAGVEGPWLAGLKFDIAGAKLMPWNFWAASWLAMLALLWLVGLVFVAILGRSDHHLYRATSSLVLVQTSAAALLVIAVSSIGFKYSEHYWFKQDWMSKLDAAGPGWSAYESKVAMQMRKELLETLGYEP